MRIDIRPTGAQGALWRALVLFRIASLVFVAIQVGRGFDDYARPGGAVGVLVAMAVWSCVASVVQPMLGAFPRGDRWQPRLPALAMVVADLAVAVATVFATRIVDTHADIVGGAATLPGPWSAGAVLGAAIAGGARLGVGAAIAMSVALYAERGAFAASTTSSATLLVLAGLVVGYLATTALKSEAEVTTLRASEAARAERDRLARAIHDSTLQALALISREAAAMDRGTIAAIAADQEAVLRSHITTIAREPDLGAGRVVDLRALLTPFETAWPHRAVTLAMPADPVLFPSADAVELAGAVQAALDNVDRHAGEQAKAWVLLEDDGDAVVVSVRDDGVGMPASRLQAAKAAGRVGLAGSVIGRVRSLGGAATVTSAPGEGVEVELRVPRR